MNKSIQIQNNILNTQEFETKELLYNFFYEIVSEIKQKKIEFSVDEYKEKINEISIQQLINYIHDSIPILLNIKIEKALEIQKEEIENNNKIIYNKNSYDSLLNIYEKKLQKLENKERNLLRQIIRLELQINAFELKLHEYILIAENYQNLKEQVRFENGKFLENDKKDNEIIILRKENSNLKIAIKKIEEEDYLKNKKILELNDKLNELNKIKNNFSICYCEKLLIKGKLKIKEIDSSNLIKYNNNINDSPKLSKVNLHFMKLNLEDSSFQKNKMTKNKKKIDKNNCFFPIMNRKKSVDNTLINNSFKLTNNYWVNIEKKPVFSLKNNEKKILKHNRLTSISSLNSYYSNSNFINVPFQIINNNKFNEIL